MEVSDIAQLRLFNQQLINSSFTTPEKLVQWMGAMQAQDAEMVKWALGIRLDGAQLSDVEQALDKGQIIRTHALRPTWHLLAADDIYWVLDLTAPQIKTSLRSRAKQLGLTDAVIRKSNRTIEKVLSKTGRATRDVLRNALETAGMRTNENRLSHLLLHAEQDQLVCSGPAEGKKQTYALLAQRVPVKKTLKKEDALYQLAIRYFTSHGPATLQDFVWWSGLKITDARKAVESVKPQFLSEIIDGSTYLFPDIHASESPSSIHLLPAYDEFLISYKDRSASLTPEQHKKAASINGIFWPVVMVDGRMKGLWKRTVYKDSVQIDAQLFHSVAKTKLKKAGRTFGDFFDLKSEVSIKSS